MTKPTAIVTAIAATALTLTACSAENWDSTHENHLTPRTIAVDGREVTCVIYKSSNAGGVSCDWGGAR